MHDSQIRAACQLVQFETRPASQQVFMTRLVPALVPTSPRAHLHEAHEATFAHRPSRRSVPSVALSAHRCAVGVAHATTSQAGVVVLPWQ